MIPLYPYPAFLAAGTKAVASDGTLAKSFYFLIQQLYQRTGQNLGVPWQVNNAVAAAGTNQASATQLTLDVNNITSGSGGVQLFNTQPGQFQIVTNSLGAPINVYPPPSGKILNIGAVNAPYSLPAGFSQMFVCDAVNAQAAAVYEAIFPDVGEIGTYFGIAVPEQFGTVGTADDSAVIQAALNALQAHGAGILLLPRSGGYNVKSEINVPSNTGILGPGTINFTGSGTLFDMNTDTFIEKVHLLGTGTGTNAIKLVGNRVVIRDNTIYNFGASGIVSFSGQSLRDIVISGNEIFACANIGILLNTTGGETVRDIHISDNSIHEIGTGQAMLIGNGGGSVTRITITGNTITNCGTNGSVVCGGIWVNGAGEVTVTGNSIDTCVGDQISMINVNQFTVSGNVSNFCGHTPGDPANSGIVMVGGVNGTVTGNQCFSSSGSGILVTSGSLLVTVSGNVLDSNSQNSSGNFGGITVGGGSSDILVVGNVSTDLQGSPTQLGIRIDTVSGVLVADNYLTGNTGAAQIIIGGGATVLTVHNNVGYNPVGVFNLTPGASPWTYTASTSPETLYVRATLGVGPITDGGAAFLASPTAANAVFTFEADPNAVFVITYSGVLTATKKVH